MAEPQPTDPIPETENPPESPAGEPEDPTSPDPLLDSGAFIDPDRNDSGAESPENQEDDQTEENVNFEPGVVIAAEPISMVRPGESSVETPPPRAVRRRDPDEMLKRPSWLPEDWKIDLRVRSSGATAGLIDRYYVEPSGKRKFRSKNEVLHFLETGSKKQKRKSETDAEASASPVGQKEKASGKRKKTKPPENILSPRPLNSYKADSVQEI